MTVNRSPKNLVRSMDPKVQAVIETLFYLRKWVKQNIKHEKYKKDTSRGKRDHRRHRDWNLREFQTKAKIHLNINSIEFVN